MPTYTDQDIQDLLAEFDLTVPDLSSRLNAVEGKIITVATGADVTDYGQVELISKLESDAAEVRANEYTDNQLLAAGVDILAQADIDSQSKYDAIEAITKAYTDGVVTSAEEAAAVTATAKAELAELNAKAYADGIVTDSEAAQIAASEARAELAETLAKAYADGIVTDAEANAIFEAEIKAQALADAALIAAKDYADSIVVTDSSEFEEFIETANREFAVLNDKTADTEVRELLMLAEDANVKIDLQTNTFRLGNTESNISTLNVQSLNYTSQLSQINHSTTGILAQANNYTYAGTGYWSGSTWIEGAISQRIRDLKVITGNGNAKLSEITEVFEDVGSGKFIARGGMVTDVNGNLAGYISTNDGSTSSFDIIATAFRLGEWVGGVFEPYLYVNSGKMILDDSWVRCEAAVIGSGTTTYINGNPTSAGQARINIGDAGGGLHLISIADSSDIGRFRATHDGRVTLTNGTVIPPLVIAAASQVFSNGTAIRTEASTGQVEFVDGVAPFTGKHSYLTAVNTPVGQLMVQGDLHARIDVNNALFYADVCNTARSRLAIGTLAQLQELVEYTPEETSKIDGSTTPSNLHTLNGLTQQDISDLNNTHLAGYINALGEGLMLVCSESGDIKAGQWLCSSSLAGHAMLQTDEETGLYEKYFTDYTIAKSSETVIWDNEPNNTKLIAVYYKGG